MRRGFVGSMGLVAFLIAALSASCGDSGSLRAVPTDSPSSTRPHPTPSASVVRPARNLSARCDAATDLTTAYLVATLRNNVRDISGDVKLHDLINGVLHACASHEEWSKALGYESIRAETGPVRTRKEFARRVVWTRLVSACVEIRQAGNAALPGCTGVP